MSKIVGLTGGIGSGKTTVSHLFAALGVPVYNSDMEAKKLMASSPELRKALKDLFGEEAYVGERLNKTYISEQIFNTKSLLNTMNSIVHPAVRKHFIAWSKRQESSYVIQEAAIIFEMGSQDFYDCTILIIAPENIRIERIISREPKFSVQDIKARIQNQWDDLQKIKLSDYVIENLDLKKTGASVLKLHQKLLARFETDQF